MSEHPNKGYESSFYLISRLVKEHVKQYWKGVVFAVIAMLVVSACTSFNAYLLKPTLDQIFFEKNRKLLYLLPLGVLGIFLVKGLATYYQNRITKFLGQKILADIQMRLYSHLIYADMKYLSDYPSGNIISRFTNDISSLRRVITDVMTNIALDMFTVIGLLFVMFYQDFQLALVATLGFPILIIPMRILAKRMRRIVRGMQVEMSDFTVRLDETFQNIKIIKSYCREKYEIMRAQKVMSRFFDLYEKSIKVDSISAPISETVGGITIAIVIMYAGHQVIEGQTTPGSFFSFLASLLLMYQPIKKLANLNTSLQEGISAARRLFMMLDSEPEIATVPNTPKTTFKSFNIEFKNVFFSYNEGNKILESVNISIPQGKTVALVGSSGGGKSTIFSLLQRLYDPDFGEITIDGKNIKKMRLDDLRQNIAFVSQEVAMFDDSIAENIRYGRLNATEDEVLDAALAAAAHDFITNLPDGYKTPVGQNGSKLSGGQRQRIAIARAILKNAPILLLDEATSALDAISEKQVQMALDYLKKGRTTIVIAHRLSTIENADLIYVISDGQVKEHGTHEELLANEGEYAALYKKYRDDINQ